MSDITVTFCGHRTIADEGVEEALVKALLDLLLPLSASDKVTFLCGGLGAFDSLCAKVIDDIKSKLTIEAEIEKILVTPYLTYSYKDYIDSIRDKYDDVMFPPIEDVPARYAIPRRNAWMVEQADMIIAYVTHSFGGAATTLRKAYQKKKNIVRLISDYDIR